MLKFTRLDEDDLLFLNEVRNECAAEYLHDSRTFTIGETIGWFVDNDPNYWIIWLDDQKIGYFRTSNYSENSSSVYIGADLHKDFRGKNIGYQSYCEFMPQLFDIFNVDTLMLEVLATNKRAKELYDRLGFKTIWVKEKSVLKNGELVDSIVMSINKNDKIG